MGERNPTKDSIEEISLNSVEKENKTFFQKIWKKLRDILQRGVEQEVAEYKAHETQEMHDSAIKYDKDTERLYSFLQIMTGAFASFAHGSNDVANAIGPLATIYLIYTTGEVDPSGISPAPIWLLALGGAAIDAGLIFYGYHVMRSLGNQITYHSPARGFSMELGTSLTVLTASKVGT
jgi:sodium-dependent phosphate transporter